MLLAQLVAALGVASFTRCAAGSLHLSQLLLQHSKSICRHIAAAAQKQQTWEKRQSSEHSPLRSLQPVMPRHTAFLNQQAKVPSQTWVLREHG
jgi:hypothetical protein